ncbi:MAG: ArnT family glycosyltransferase [Minisyncoccia bacterium]
MIRLYNKFFLLFFIGITIFYFLNITRYPSFWMDEAWDTSVAWSFITKGIFGNSTYPLYGVDKVFFLHPPLPILLEIPLIYLFGITPLTIHFWPLVCSLGSIFLLYLLIKKLFGEKTALWSALFLALNPLFFLMSRQLRPEIYVTFFGILSFYLLALGKERKKPFFYFLTGITSGLSFLSHYYGAFLIGAIFFF